MHVWKSTFLVLNGVDICDCSSENALFHDIFQKAFALEEEHACDNVRSITRRLAREDCIFDFDPIRIGCESDEKIRTAKNVQKCYVTVGTFTRRGLSSTAKTLRSLESGSSYGVLSSKRT